MYTRKHTYIYREREREADGHYASSFKSLDLDGDAVLSQEEVRAQSHRNKETEP